MLNGHLDYLKITTDEDKGTWNVDGSVCHNGNTPWLDG